MRKATGSYRTYSSLIKLKPWTLSLRWKTCLWAELQPWCLSLQRKTCPWAVYSDDDEYLSILTAEAKYRHGGIISRDSSVVIWQKGVCFIWFLFSKYFFLSLWWFSIDLYDVANLVMYPVWIILAQIFQKSRRVQIPRNNNYKQEWDAQGN